MTDAWVEPSVGTILAERHHDTLIAVEHPARVRIGQCWSRLRDRTTARLLESRLWRGGEEEALAHAPCCLKTKPPHFSPAQGEGEY
jgi:hypothetical protein